MHSPLWQVSASFAPSELQEAPPVQPGPLWPLGVTPQAPEPLQLGERQVPPPHSFLRSSLAVWLTQALETHFWQVGHSVSAQQAASSMQRPWQGL